MTILLSLLTGLAAASDHPNLEHGLPISVVDAQPISYLGRELQMLARYEYTAEDDDLLHLEPRLEYGIFRNAQISLAGPLLFGEDVRDGPRELRADGMYAINRERLVLPGFAVEGHVDLPIWPAADDIEPGVALIASKTIPGTMQLHQLHANVGVTFNVTEDAGERDAAYELVFGYMTRITNSLVFLADIVREQELEDDVEHNLAEVGLRYQVNPWVVISGGSGFGFGDESPQVRPTLGFQAAI